MRTVTADTNQQKGSTNMSFEWDINHDALIRSIVNKEHMKINIPPTLADSLSDDEKVYLKKVIARLLNPTYEDLLILMQCELSVFKDWEEDLTPGIDWDHQKYADRIMRLLQSFNEQKFLKESYFTDTSYSRMLKDIDNSVVRDKEYEPEEIPIDELKARLNGTKYEPQYEAFVAESEDGKWISLNIIDGKPYEETFVDKEMAKAWASGYFDILELPKLHRITLAEYMRQNNLTSLHSEAMDAIYAADNDFRLDEHEIGSINK